MALLMTRPIKHPRTGIFLFRKRVPADLIAVIGQAEVTRSLGTRDPAEAKRRHLKVLSEIEAQWANLRAGPRTLTHEEAYELAAVVHDRWVDKTEDGNVGAGASVPCPPGPPLVRIHGFIRQPHPRESHATQPL